jgi:hypothetical protein
MFVSPPLAHPVSDDVYMKEADVVSKVGELLETLDQIKRYNALAQSIQKFAIIVVGTIIGHIALQIVFVASRLSLSLGRTGFLTLSVASLLLPILGTFGGILYVRGRINAVRTGQWRDELTQGFPAALKMLSELDWEGTFDEIVTGKLSYTLYGLIKIGAYCTITFLVLHLMFHFLVVHFIPLITLGEVLLSLLIVFSVLGNDIFTRYKEIHGLDMLLWELRWFSIEFSRAEFKT